MREEAQESMAECGQVAETGEEECIARFEYPERGDGEFIPSCEDLAGWEGRREAEAEAPAPEPPQPAPGEYERLLSEQSARSFENGRQRGVEEGRRLEREAAAAATAAAQEERIRQAAALSAEFARQRETYFKAAEQEVVRLALGAAARILRREAQTDPLLLMGAVRVALGQLAASTEVKVRVPAADLDLWTEAVALLPHRGPKPLVVAGEGMRVGECRLETSLGTADLSLRAQLGEIEQALVEAGADAAAQPAPAAVEAAR